jgi:F0F1-type ATP synthase membrane subunit b/b'
MLSINGNVIVVFLIVWILVFVLTRFFFNPVRRARAAREKYIQENRSAGQKAMEDYERSLQEVEMAVRQAKAAAESARDALEAEGLKEKSRLLAEVGAECRAQVEKARADLDSTVKDLKGKLETEALALAETIEKKFLS